MITIQFNGHDIDLDETNIENIEIKSKILKSRKITGYTVKVTFKDKKISEYRTLDKLECDNFIKQYKEWNL